MIIHNNQSGSEIAMWSTVAKITKRPQNRMCSILSNENFNNIMTFIPTLAVLLTCHNRKDKTLHCLQALFEQRDFDVNYTIEVFLADVGSTDGTKKAITIQYPKVKIIQGYGNLYWNRGMHLA